MRLSLGPHVCCVTFEGMANMEPRVCRKLPFVYVAQNVRPEHMFLSGIGTTAGSICVSEVRSIVVYRNV